jgi:glycosyltransferase involved in cell wall biosynthesis
MRLQKAKTFYPAVLAAKLRRVLGEIVAGSAPVKARGRADRYPKIENHGCSAFSSGGPRILHYLSSTVRAGAEEHALSLVTRLGEYGFTPYLAAPTPLLETMAAELARAGVRRLAIEAVSPFDLREAARLRSALIRERIDIVHSHMFHASCFASPVARSAGVPCVVETCHGREAWRQGKRLKGHFWFDRQIGRLVDRYIAVSHASARHLQESKRILARKITVIHNGRDLVNFRPPTPRDTAVARAQLGLCAGPVILTVARLDEQKGHRFLIDALGPLVRFQPHLVALFVGDGPLERELKAQSDAAGLTDHIRFLGYRADVARCLAAADVVALPSLYEGLPLAAIEALGAARPVVATEVDGTPEVVVDGDSGLLVPPADPVATAMAIKRLLDDPQLAARLAANGRAFAERHFDIRIQVARTVAVYDELTGGATRRAA